MNNDSNNDLARYHGFPPLTPHKPMERGNLALRKSSYQLQTTELNNSGHNFAIGLKAGKFVYRNHTPTIPQMEDRHERQVFTDKAERVVNQVLAFALTVLAVVFVGGLMYKTFVWGH
jgi:hypothetical protein